MGDDASLSRRKYNMWEQLRQQCERWRRGLVQSLLRIHDPDDHTISRVMLLGLGGTIGMPLYYLIWHYSFPQPYENLVLRTLGVMICLPAPFVRRLPASWRKVYLVAGLTYVLPFFFTFMFLMNHASAVWTQSLLVALIILFHFDINIATLAYVSGTLLACVAFWGVGDVAFLLDGAVLRQLPIHWFAIAVLSVAKVGRNVLAQEKLAGLGAGLASVAHELRTPLTSVDANVRGLKRLLPAPGAAGDAEQAGLREALARIQFEVRHMNHMIDLFLLSASAVNQNLRPDTMVSMATVVDSVIRRYPFVGDAQQQAVVVEVRDDFRFAGQTELSVVILLNLLRNALKAIQRAGKGRVRIVVDGARATPRLLFIDTGCGIAARHLPLIFRRFYSYPAHNGSGIGLALCKDIVEAWGASIRCVARESAYAIFILEFPRPASGPSL
jgi:two-component system CAI-1 autoinducer sensor kinase/phosphatase CqsS